MKRRDLIKHLQENGCHLLREGGKYSIFTNPTKGVEVPVTRHPELPDFSARKICKQLGIPEPGR